MLVQTHGAEGAHRETHLLPKTHQQPVDLTPQVPKTQTSSFVLQPTTEHKTLLNLEPSSVKL